MKPPASRPLARFLLKVAGWLPVCFAIWYFAAPILVWPVSLASQAVAKIGLSDLVGAVEQHGRNVTFVTTLRPVQAAPLNSSASVLSVDVNALLYMFGLPLFAACTVAAGQRNWLRLLGLGYVVLLPCAILGVNADLLRHLAISLGPAIASQTGFAPVEREMIAFVYQFSTLILPTVVPAAAWVLTHRQFIENLLTAPRDP